MYSLTLFLVMVIDHGGHGGHSGKDVKHGLEVCVLYCIYVPLHKDFESCSFFQNSKGGSVTQCLRAAWLPK